MEVYYPPTLIPVKNLPDAKTAKVESIIDKIIPHA